MTIEEDIQTIQEAFNPFSRELLLKIEAFESNRYDTLLEDVGQEAWIQRDFIQRNLEDIGNFYEFVRLIDDVFKLEFITTVRNIAAHYDYRMKNPLVWEHNNKAMLALELALYYPLWGRETYTNLDFRSIILRREVLESDAPQLFVTESRLVPILTIEVDENGHLDTIEPVTWNFIHSALQNVVRE